MLPTTAAFTYISRHWRVAREANVADRFLRGLGKGLIGQAAIAAVGVALIGLLQFSRLPMMGLIALFIHATGWSVYQGLLIIPTMERHRVTAGVLDLSGNVLRQLVLAIGAGLFLGAQTGIGLLSVQAAYSVVLGLSTFFIVFGQRARFTDIAQAQRSSDQLGPMAALRYSGPFLLGALFAQVATSAERWGLKRLADASATALFVQAVGLSTAIAAAALLFLNTYFHPIIAQAAARGNRPLKQTTRPLWTYLALATCALALVAVAFATNAKLITHLFFGPKYDAVASLLPWTTLGSCLFMLGQTLAIVGYVSRDAVGPNVARVLSLALYSLSLVRSHPSHDAALSFSRLYALGQAMYVVLMFANAIFLFRREHREAVRRPLRETG
jgi:hypothetical protein